jgi:hypothetical protein
MPRLKLTKTVVETAQPEKEPYELRDAAIPGFLLKVTPTGRKVFMVAYAANNGSAASPPSAALARSRSSRPGPSPRIGWPTSARARIRVQRRAPHAGRPQ